MRCSHVHAGIYFLITHCHAQDNINLVTSPFRTQRNRPFLFRLILFLPMRIYLIPSSFTHFDLGAIVYWGSLVMLIMRSRRSVYGSLDGTRPCTNANWPLARTVLHQQHSRLHKARRRKVVDEAQTSVCDGRKGKLTRGAEAFRVPSRLYCREHDARLLASH